MYIYTQFLQERSRRLLVATLMLCMVTVECGRSNVLLVIVDNLRPSLGCYGQKEVVSPHIDSLAKDGVVFTQAFCQIAWCSPSRNSFLTGKRPDDLKIYGFRRSFREEFKQAVTLPEYLMKNGFYATSLGKTFHPRLPPRFDYPLSWSDEPFFVDKPQCVAHKMSCGVNNSYLDADSLTTRAAIRRLRMHVRQRRYRQHSPENFFMVVGYQSPRLPWVYPEEVVEKFYPKLSAISVAQHSLPTGMTSLEWFRPNEIDIYSDVRNVTYWNPVNASQERELRRAYYATVTHVDRQVGMLVRELEELDLRSETSIVLIADHGQNLGEYNMWSMMNLLETSLQVPMIINYARSHPRKHVGTYRYPVELLDLFPTIVALAGLPSSRHIELLPGLNLLAALDQNAPVREYARSQITRCFDCSLAYRGTTETCEYDESVDHGFAVPCAMTPLDRIDYMGYSIRSVSGWRYTLFCEWDKVRLMANFSRCEAAELYQLTGVKGFSPDFAYDNLAGRVEYGKIETRLRNALIRAFNKPTSITLHSTSVVSQGLSSFLEFF